MSWIELYRQIAELIPADHLALVRQRPIIHINVDQQSLCLVQIDPDQSKTYPVSTAAKGIGNQSDSLKTPSGVHQIRQKIGAGQPWGMIYKNRMATGRICDPCDIHEEDEISSRILWLDGLQLGINQGGACDTYHRHIYIHGTSDEKRIGYPVSIGCIRMKNDDVIQLFDQVQVNDLVIIW